MKVCRRGLWLRRNPSSSDMCGIHRSNQGGALQGKTRKLSPMDMIGRKRENARKKVRWGNVEEVPPLRSSWRNLHCDDFWSERGGIPRTTTLSNTGWMRVTQKRKLGEDVCGGRVLQRKATLPAAEWARLRANNANKTFDRETSPPSIRRVGIKRKDTLPIAEWASVQVCYDRVATQSYHR